MKNYEEIVIRSLGKSNVDAAAQAMWRDIRPVRTEAVIRRGVVMKQPNTAVPILIRQETKWAVRG